MTDPIPPLFHFTCEHAATKIGLRGKLLPVYQPVIGRSLVWLTDLDRPDVDALGLTSTTLDCDRTAFRYDVVDPYRLGPLPWSDYALASRVLVTPRVRLEAGRKPQHWWVSLVPVPVVRYGGSLR